MKLQKINAKLALLCMSLLIVTASCGKDDTGSPEDEDMQGKAVQAGFSFDNGTEIKFAGAHAPSLKPTLMYNKGDAIELLVMNSLMTQDGTLYGLSVIAGIDGVGTYHFIAEAEDDEKGVSFTVTVGADKSTAYLPFRTKDETLGTCTLKITSLTDTHMKATFSATLYSETGKVVVKDGKIDTEIVRREFES